VGRGVQELGIHNTIERWGERKRAKSLPLPVKTKIQRVQNRKP